MRGLFLLLIVAAAGCEQRAGTVAPAPRPPPVVARFVESAVAVLEGETAEIAIRYRTNGEAGLVLEVVAVPGSAGPADYELPMAAVPLDPAGVTAMVPLAALSDHFLSEGEETLSLVLRLPGGVASEVGPGLEVTISDAGVTPCPGVTALASPLDFLDGTGFLATTLELDFTSPGEAVRFDWIGPHRHDEDCNDDDCRRWWTRRTSYLELNIADWRVGIEGGEVRHALDIEWHFSNELGLRFRSDAPPCEGEPTIRCTRDECELDRIEATFSRSSR